jgi:hypothetical protein
MSRKDRGLHDQTDSKSRQAARTGLPLGVGVFLDGHPAEGGTLLTIEPALSYDATLARSEKPPEGMTRLAFKWVEQSIWNHWMARRPGCFGTGPFAADPSSGTGTPGRFAYSLIDPVTREVFLGPIRVKCPEGSAPDGLGGCREVG